MDLKKIINLGDEEEVASLQVSESVEVQAEFTGVAVGSFTTPLGGRGSTPRARGKRVRTRSESSPEEDARELVQEWRDEAVFAIEEIKAYTAKNFSQKHEAYFGSRFVKLMDVFRRMEAECLRANRMSQRVFQVEKRLKSLVEIDWGKQIVDAVEKEAREAGERAYLRVQQEVGEALERIKREVGGAFDTMTALERERMEEMKSIGGVVKEVDKVIRGEMGGVKEELKLSRAFMEDVKGNMERVYERVADVHDSVGPLEEKLMRGLDARVAGVSAGVDVGMAESVVEVVERAVRGVTERMCESKSEGVNGMEVDAEPSWSNVVRRGRSSRGPRVKIEVPRDERKVTREELVECLDAKGGDVRVRGLVRKGKDYVVEVHDPSDVEKLRVNPKLKEKGLVVDGLQGWRLPRVRLYDVDRSIGKQDLMECVRRRNGVFVGMTDEECKSEFVPEYMIGRAKEVGDWVIRVSARVFQRLYGCGRIYVGLRVCRVVEYVDVRRCNKCQRFGHLGRFCAARVTCGWCGEEGHHETACTKRREQKEPNCANCSRYGFSQRSHPAAWKGCPVHEVQKRAQIRNTSYV